MKTIAIFLLLASGIIAPVLAGDVTIRIGAIYENVDAKWLSDLSPETQRNALNAKDGRFQLPAVPSASGQPVTVARTKKVATGTSIPKESAVPCGVIADWYPELIDGSIHISGKSLFRRSTNKNAEGVATRFETQEVLIDLILEAGATKSVELEDGGKLLISAILVDAEGREIKR